VFLLVSIQPASAFFRHHSLKVGSGGGANIIDGNYIPLFDGVAVEYEGAIGNNVSLSVYWGSLGVPEGGVLKNSSAEVKIVGGGFRFYLTPFSTQAFSGFFTGIGISNRSMDLSVTVPLPASATYTGVNYYLELGYAHVLGPLSLGLSLQGGFMNGTLNLITGLPADFDILSNIPQGNISGAYAGVRGYLSIIF